MNKTVSIHLQGVPFILEEQAFDRLNSYMLQLKEILQKEEGSDEIIQDIELRMVELIQQKLTPFKQVVELSVIEQIIEKLGEPEVFSDDTEAIHETTSALHNDSVEKRLFRDGDRAMIGGVCAGVAAYFNIDVVIVRVIYICCFLTFGIGFLLYIALWAIIPIAKTSSDKLRMKGQHVNLENMKSELEDAANRIKKGAREFKSNSGIQSTFGSILRVISVIIGIWALLFGTGIFVLAIIFFVNPAIIPAQLNGRFMSFQDVGELLFESASHATYFYLGVALISIAVIAQSYLFGIRLITQFKASYLKVFTAIFGLTLVVGIVLVSLGGVQIGRSMAIYGEVEKEIATISGSHLNIEKKSIEGELINGYKIKSNGDQGLVTVKNGRVYLSGIELVYSQSSDTLFHIKQLNDAQGSTHERALKKARNIACNCELQGSNMLLETMYSFPKADKFRDQNVKFMISVPIGGKIFYHKQQVYPRMKQETDAPNETYQHGYIESDGTYSNW